MLHQEVIRECKGMEMSCMLKWIAVTKEITLGLLCFHALGYYMLS